MGIHNKTYFYKGKNWTLTELSIKYAISRKTLYDRLTNNGFTLEEALTISNIPGSRKRHKYQSKTYADYLREAGYDPRKYITREREEIYD